MPLDNDATRSGRLEPEALNETNMLELYVFASAKHRQAILVARLDNLGKGASGAAVEYAVDAGVSGSQRHRLALTSCAGSRPRIHQTSREFFEEA